MVYSTPLSLKDYLIPTRFEVLRNYYQGIIKLPSLSRSEWRGGSRRCTYRPLELQEDHLFRGSSTHQGTSSVDMCLRSRFLRLFGKRSTEDSPSPFRFLTPVPVSYMTNLQLKGIVERWRQHPNEESSVSIQRTYSLFTSTKIF